MGFFSPILHLSLSCLSAMLFFSPILHLSLSCLSAFLVYIMLKLFWRGFCLGETGTFHSTSVHRPGVDSNAFARHLTLPVSPICPGLCTSVSLKKIKLLTMCFSLMLFRRGLSNFLDYNYAWCLPIHTICDVSVLSLFQGQTCRNINCSLCLFDFYAR